MRFVMPFLIATMVGCSATDTDQSGGSTASHDDAGEETEDSSSQDPEDTETTDDPTPDSSSSDTGEEDEETTDEGSTGEPPPPPPPPTTTPGCGMVPSGDVLDGVIDVGEVQRNYIIEIPDDYDPDTPYPIAFGFHGRGGDSVSAQNSHNLFEHFGGQAIVVYPEKPVDVLWNIAGDGDDIAFVMELAQEIGFEMCFDLDRVFAYGYSSGASMAQALGCHRGDFFRGIGAASGWAPSIGLCQGPITAFMSHGETDTTVPFNQGVSARDGWLQLNGCSETTTPAAYEGCVSYEGCENPVMWCTFDGGHMLNSDYAAEAVDLFNSL